MLKLCFFRDKIDNRMHKRFKQTNKNEPQIKNEINKTMKKEQKEQTV